MRTIDATLQSAITAPVLCPAWLADLQFKAGMAYAWTGLGSLVWNGNTYKGLGRLAQVGAITEGVNVEAFGTTLTLNGIDPTLYSDCVSDIVTGLPAVVRLAALDLATGAIVGTPLVMFSGLIDQAPIVESGESISVTLHLSSKLANLQRANRRLYTAADQRIKYPNDSGFNWVEVLQCIANMWG